MLNPFIVLFLSMVLLLPGCGGGNTDPNSLRYSCKLTGKVVKVVDGDTAYVLDSSKVQHKIRFAGIDAPERNQPFGQVSKQFVSKMIAGKTVCVDYQEADRWGRLIGSIVIDDQLLNLEVVKAGLAWHYKRYQKEQTPVERKLYAEAEENARTNRLGLWVDQSPVAPWDWRNW